MSKSTFFTGQPIFTQLLNLMDRKSIKALARVGGYDHYYKSFDTYTHLVTMLYCSLQKCTSSREVVSGMKACFHKLIHLGIRKPPARSTLCDANKNRSADVFGDIYRLLHSNFKHLLPDSQNMKRSKLFIADSSTITLFQQILKAPSMGKANGKRKGGIKVHTLMSAEENVAIKIDFTSARANDMTFLQKIHLSKGSFIVFDKGYVDYAQYQRMSDEGVFFVTRQRKRADYDQTYNCSLKSNSIQSGVLKDEHIILGTRTHAKKIRLKSRMVTFADKEKGRIFQFLTNNFDLEPEEIADLYKQRWQIEILFKRVKQNFPLKYFLGDNINAIKIQIWCAFIADLLIRIIQAQLKKKWAFSNLRSIIRIHLMSYINLFRFLNNPDLLKPRPSNPQLEIEGLKINFKT
ncbi:MAG: IS4 family transposase [Cyclobacteriaceae bacterium]